MARIVKMKTIFIKYYRPEEVSDLTLNDLSDEELKDLCFKAFKCKDEASALNTYANTRATWSTILDDSDELFDVNDFIEQAIRAIRDYDYEWLEKFFT